MMELKLEYDDSNEFYVNLEEVAHSSEIPATLRLLALDLIKHPYMSIGDFLKRSSDRSIEELVEMVNAIDEDENAMQDLTLLTMMLMTAEGLVLENDDDLLRNIKALIMIICGESLARKGMVRMFYDNISFGEDMQNRTIMEKL